MHRFHFVPTILIIVMLQIGSAGAQDNSPEARPKIGLVLSGGGARGAAHLGVLKVLEANQVPVDFVVGTSIGALVGGLYASGYSVDELSNILENIDWQTVLSTEAPRNHRSFRRKQDDDGLLIQFRLGIKHGKLQLPSGLITPNNLRLMLRSLSKNVAHVHDFDKLAIPFRAVATDLETGSAVVLDKGDLASSMVASMAVPALFPPVELNGRLLVDGGVSNNIPIDVARALGADIVIVVDISTPMKTKDDISSFTSVINQLTLIMTNSNAAKQLATLREQDIVIRPDVADVGFVDFDRTGKAVPKGEIAALRVIEQLRALALPDTTWQNYIKTKRPKELPLPVIDFVKISNKSKISDDVIRSRLTQEIGQPLDIQGLLEDLTKIYGIRLFDTVDYRTLETGGKTGLEIRARGRENGDSQIRFGLALQDNFSGESGFQLAAAINQLAMNSRGGELEAQITVGDNLGLFSEFYQPLDYADRYYVFANGGVNKLNRNIMSADGKGDLVSQVRISGASFLLGAGRNFGQWGTARIGLQRSFSKIRGRIGLPSSVVISTDTTTLTAGFEIDTLDNPRFPHAGLAFEATYSNGVSFLGGDNKVDSLLVSAYAPFSWGKNTLGLALNAGTAFNGRPDETNLFPLGGFLSLAAFAPGQLTGNHGGNLSAVYYRRIGGPGYLAQTPFYVGASIETGNVWNDASDISLGDLKWSSSLFVGADTLIGPIYLGGAIGSKGETAAFLVIGQLF